MGRTLSSSSNITATVLGIPVGGYADVFTKGANYKQVGSVLPRSLYPELSAAFPASGIGMYASNATNLPSGNYKDMASGNGRFVACGDAGVISVSTDGRTWAEVTRIGNFNFSSIDYAVGLFVMVDSSATGVVWTSPDGMVWTSRAIPVTLPWTKVRWCGDRFLVLAGEHTISVSNVLLSSFDGIVWTQRALPVSRSWIGAAFGNGKYVITAMSSAVAATPTTSFCYSSDGINWTEGNMPSAQIWGCITFGNGIFVALSGRGSAGAPTLAGAYSNNGIAWSAMTMPSHNYYEIKFADGKFFTTTKTAESYISEDGTRWNSRGLTSNVVHWTCFAFLDGHWAVAPGGPGAGSTACTLYVEGAVANYIYISGVTGKYVRVS